MVTDQIPEYDIIIHEDDRLIRSIDVNNESDGSDYSFTGFSATMKVDATRPATSTVDATYTSSGGDITLTAGNVAIDCVHGLSVGEYLYDFIITTGTKNTTLFTGRITVKESI
jgi:hypothetical protein